MLRKVNIILKEHGGIDVQISAAVWTTTLLNPWQKKLVELNNCTQHTAAFISPNRQATLHARQPSANSAAKAWMTRITP